MSLYSSTVISPQTPTAISFPSHQFICGHRNFVYCAKPTAPAPIDSGAKNTVSQMNRKLISLPSRFGPKASDKYRYGPPVPGIAAPSSAHTNPSQMATSAPISQPSIACGPFIAVSIRGMVMNGPTPIISSIFAEVASRSPSLRCRWREVWPGTAGFSHTFAEHRKVR
jgi:hypothetical protein